MKFWELNWIVNWIEMRYWWLNWIVNQVDVMNILKNWIQTLCEKLNQYISVWNHFPFSRQLHNSSKAVSLPPISHPEWTEWTVSQSSYKYMVSINIYIVWSKCLAFSIQCYNALVTQRYSNQYLVEVTSDYNSPHWIWSEFVHLTLRFVCRCSSPGRYSQPTTLLVSIRVYPSSHVYLTTILPGEAKSTPPFSSNIEYVACSTDGIVLLSHASTVVI